MGLDVTQHILHEYAAKYLTDLALTTLPLGGIYLTGSVLTDGFRFALMNDPLFIEKFQNRGSQAPLLKRIPISLVTRSDLAQQGCLHYAR